MRNGTVPAPIRSANHPTDCGPIQTSIISHKVLPPNSMKLDLRQPAPATSEPPLTQRRKSTAKLLITAALYSALCAAAALVLFGA